MKLMICIAHQRYGTKMIKHLSEKGYRVTKLASSGGFLKEGKDTLLIGVSNQDIKQLKSEMRSAVDALDKEKGWQHKEENRYTSFVVDGQNSIAIPR
ncbi:cyclic-di-AMP receptor [Caldalkalibacillus salinus]|uniref:cyclic-di-AMP receptor n=1 Tax=Caldalkalibacillus salinus TaxID=2803787 RepID=UPI001924376D|nr:cyclic-di-AMP receptor [Caldalkalibacillus salinus]